MKWTRAARVCISITSKRFRGKRYTQRRARAHGRIKSWKRARKDGADCEMMFFFAAARSEKERKKQSRRRRQRPAPKPHFKEGLSGHVCSRKSESQQQQQRQRQQQQHQGAICLLGNILGRRRRRCLASGKGQHITTTTAVASKRRRRWSMTSTRILAPTSNYVVARGGNTRMRTRAAAF